MNFIRNNLQPFKEWYEEKKREWLDEGKLKDELDYIASYLMGVACGWLYKYSEELYWERNWFRRAFMRFYEAEPLKITYNPSPTPPGPPNTTIVVSYENVDGEAVMMEFGGKRKL